MSKVYLARTLLSYNIVIVIMIGNSICSKDIGELNVSITLEASFNRLSTYSSSNAHDSKKPIDSVLYEVTNITTNKVNQPYIYIYSPHHPLSPNG